MDMMTFKRNAAAVALKKLLTGSVFYVNDFKDIAKLMDIDTSQVDMRPFEVLHCVKWVDMPEELVKEVKMRILEVFQLPVHTVEDMIKTVNPDFKTVEPETINRPRLAFWRK